MSKKMVTEIPKLHFGRFTKRFDLSAREENSILEVEVKFIISKGISKAKAIFWIVTDTDYAKVWVANSIRNRSSPLQSTMSTHHGRLPVVKLTR